MAPLSLLQNKLCGEMNVRGYPTMYFGPARNFTMQEGERELTELHTRTDTGIVSFIEKIIGRFGSLAWQFVFAASLILLPGSNSLLLVGSVVRCVSFCLSKRREISSWESLLPPVFVVCLRYLVPTLVPFVSKNHR